VNPVKGVKRLNEDQRYRFGVTGPSSSRICRAITISLWTGLWRSSVQIYTAETMTLPIRKAAFMIDDPKSLWNGKSLYGIYEEAHSKR
jgi:N-acetylneuraminate synthase